MLGDCKAPGIDGLNAKCCKSTWSIVGEDVKRAVHDFFLNKRLYHGVNCTLVALVPKIIGPCSMKNMRPISCCTTVYKTKKF